MGSQSTDSTSTEARATVASHAGHEGNAGGSEATKEIDSRLSLQIDCLRNARYHEDRERFFAFIHKLTMFVVVLGGTTAFAFVSQYRFAVAIISIAAIADLVFDVSGKARLHASLRRRCNDVLAQSHNLDRDVASLKEQAVGIYGDEPPCMHAVNALAYNAAMRAFDRPEKYLFKISSCQRVFRHVWAYTSEDFETYEELGRSAKAVGVGPIS